MSTLPKYLAALALLLFSCSLASTASTGSSTACTFDPTKDFNATAFYLEPSSNRFRYPDATGQLIVGGVGDKGGKDGKGSKGGKKGSKDDKKNKVDSTGLRIVCPNGEIVTRQRPTNLTESMVECVAGSTVKLQKTFFYSPLNLFGCDVVAEPIVRMTERTSSDGKKIVEIGYAINETSFLPIIEDIAVNSWTGGYVPRWAHFKAVPVAASSTPMSKSVLKSSPLAPKVNFDYVYSVTKQRNSFYSVFNDTALVDKYLPADGTHSFVPSQLVAPEDLYYERQRAATAFYEATVPVWKSVESGNWHRVGEAVRQIAAETAGEIDVWSGTYLSLWLHDSQNETTYVNLPLGLKPSQFLFKYVHDAAANRGIVFVTVNNPHLEEADRKNVICEELETCKTEYPEFDDFSEGYTYCCSLQSFETQATTLGLPLFNDATQIIL